MDIAYTEEKKFTMEQVQELFRSVGWVSGEYPQRLYKALMHSSRVTTAWDGARLVGLAVSGVVASAQPERHRNVFERPGERPRRQFDRELAAAGVDGMRRGRNRRVSGNSGRNSSDLQIRSRPRFRKPADPFPLKAALQERAGAA